jgi:CubicO group peptidase (beta-lactamase class C family)
MRDQTHKRIFSPLAMRNTHWTLRDTPAALTATPYDIADGTLTRVEPVGFPDWPAGMLRSSMADFIRFLAASANHGAALGSLIVKPQTMAQMLDMQTPPGLPDWLTGQGLGWMASPLNGISTPNHWGGDPGVFTAVYIDPAKRAGVALFANTTTSKESKAAIKSIASRILSNDIHD